MLGKRENKKNFQWHTGVLFALYVLLIDDPPLRAQMIMVDALSASL